jgi:signal transduction histidine kinase
LGLLVAVMLTVTVATGLVYVYSRQEVNALSDANLVQQARVLGVLLNHEASEELEREGEIGRLERELGPEAVRRSPLLAKMVRNSQHTARRGDYLDMHALAGVQAHRYETRVNFFVRYPGGQIMIRSPGTVYFQVPGDGFETVSRNGRQWRVYTLTMPDNHLLVQLSQDMGLRQTPINAMLNRALWPLFIMMPVLGLIIWRRVGTGLGPLRALAAHLERRDPHSLELISTRDLPQELLPMVAALNHLFSRVDAAMENEHRFTSDAAHELRNPLAALKTRVQVFELTTDDEEHRAFARAMLTEIDRTTHLLSQLLMLARADARQREQAYAEIDLLPLCEETLAGFGARALDRDIRLTLEGASARVAGDRTALGILLGNLVQNAINYIPRGGQVTVRLLALPDRVELQVEDDGGGIPPEFREAFFERFRRGEHREQRGSGLGLSIVRQIAELHHARVYLEDRSDGHGLLVRVVFSRPSAAGEAR